MQTCHSRRIPSNGDGVYEAPQRYTIPRQSPLLMKRSLSSKKTSASATSTPRWAPRSTSHKGQISPRCWNSSTAIRGSSWEKDHSSNDYPFPEVFTRAGERDRRNGLNASRRGNSRISVSRTGSRNRWSTPLKGSSIATPNTDRQTYSANSSAPQQYLGGFLNTNQYVGYTSHDDAKPFTCATVNTDNATKNVLGDLEGFITDVMGVRMQSMTDINNRLEELSELQRREAELFKVQMNALLSQSAQAAKRNIQQQSVADDKSYALLLEKERSDRLRAVEMLRAFKTEGEEVMKGLRASLSEAQTKWKQEVERNARLTAQLRAAAGNGSSIGKSDTSKDDMHPSNFEAKIEALSSLLEEEESIIIELKQRNRNLESKLASVQQEKDRISRMVAALEENNSEIETEYNAAVTRLQKLSVYNNNSLNKVQGSANNSPSPHIIKTKSSSIGSATAESQVKDNVAIQGERVLAIQRYAAIVVRKLKAEQRQRLISEEQCAKVVGAQEQRVHKLEAHVAALKAQLQQQRNTTTKSPIKGPPHAVVNTSISPKIKVAIAKSPVKNANESPHAPIPVAAVASAVHGGPASAVHIGYPSTTIHPSHKSPQRINETTVMNTATEVSFAPAAPSTVDSPVTSRKECLVSSEPPTIDRLLMRLQEVLYDTDDDMPIRDYAKEESYIAFKPVCDESSYHNAFSLVTDDRDCQINKAESNNQQQRDQKDGEQSATTSSIRSPSTALTSSAQKLDAYRRKRRVQNFNEPYSTSGNNADVRRVCSITTDDISYAKNTTSIPPSSQQKTVTFHDKGNLLNDTTFSENTPPILHSSYTDKEIVSNFKDVGSIVNEENALAKISVEFQNSVHAMENALNRINIYGSGGMPFETCSNTHDNSSDNNNTAYYGSNSIQETAMGGNADVAPFRFSPSPENVLGEIKDDNSNVTGNLEVLNTTTVDHFISHQSTGHQDEYLNFGPADQ